ncbi:MAG: thioredoxin family protein [Bacilli bacterium]|nr:thioredoxin family protein [Bacilli bacterium]
MKIIKIGAVWCPGCLVMKKVWKNICNDYDLDITELDLDMDTLEANEYNPGKVLPIVIFLDDNGNELERLVGEQSEDNLRGVIDKYVGD